MRTTRSFSAGLFAVSTFLALSASAQTPRILLVGDSWAARAWRSRAFRAALVNRGLPQFEEKGDATTMGGSTAAFWASPEGLARIARELETYPTIDIVHLSIGGNDFLQSGARAPMEGLPILLGILRDVRTVVERVHRERPEARIAYASYDYIASGDGHAFELGVLARAIRFQARRDPRYFLLDNLGVLHHAFGYPGAFGPGETPLPGSYPRYRPFLGGDPNFPGSPEVFADEIHPSDEAFVRLAEHAIDAIYGDWLSPTVAIDVRPGDDTNVVDPGARGLLPVAILGSSDFDVWDVNLETLAFGPSDVPASRLGRGLVLDVNRDGLDDMLAFYPIARAGIEEGDTEACVTFRTFHGVFFTGCDSIWTLSSGPTLAVRERPALSPGVF